MPSIHGGTRHRGQRGNLQPSCLLNHSLTGWTVLRRNLTLKTRPTRPGQHDWLDIVPYMLVHVGCCMYMMALLHQIVHRTG